MLLFRGGGGGGLKTGNTVHVNLKRFANSLVRMFYHGRVHRIMLQA